MSDIKSIVETLDKIALKEARLDPQIAQQFDALTKAKTQVPMALPKVIGMDDYHEIDMLNDIFAKLGIAAKAYEAGFDYATGSYNAVVLPKGVNPKPYIRALDNILEKLGKNG